MQNRSNREEEWGAVVGNDAALQDRRGGALALSFAVPRRALFDRLSAARGVTLVCAPAGSGKSVLLGSWIEHAGLANRVAWVSIERGERDAQRFWLSIAARLREVAGAARSMPQVAPTPDFNGQAFTERLQAELQSLDDLVVLVIDNVDELSVREARQQLEWLLSRRPPALRVMLASRTDPQLGLHRLRLSGDLMEIRANDLRFSLEETRELLAAAGIRLSEGALRLLHTRTEGWAAGLRLAVLSLTGHPDPEHFVVEFSGSERTVADYLLSEVLDRQPEEVRHLLLRTSILRRVSGPLADTLTGGSGSERILHALDQANAFVVALDASRSWFRYHHLFADLLQLELRRTDPDALPTLHRRAAGWLAEYGDFIDAIRHAQAAQDWRTAELLLADHGLSLVLDGRGPTVRRLLGAFPRSRLSNPELSALAAYLEMRDRSLETAAEYVQLAELQASAVPPERQRRFELQLAIDRLSIARRRGDFATVIAEVQPVLDLPSAGTLDEVKLANDARALALMNLGIVETWAGKLAEGEAHLEEALELARRIGRPYVEIGCLGQLAVTSSLRSYPVARDYAARAIAVSEAHGWAEDYIVSTALAMMAGADIMQGRLPTAKTWLERADRALRPGLYPAIALLVEVIRGMLHVGQGQFNEAVRTFIAAERLQSRLVSRQMLMTMVRPFLLYSQLRLHDTQAARATLGTFSDEERESGEARAAIAAVQLAEHQAQAAIETVAPVLSGIAPVLNRYPVIHALLMDAMARDRLADRTTAEADIERALALAEPEGIVFPFLFTPPDQLLQQHPRHRTAHAALLGRILDALGGASPSDAGGEPLGLREELSESELRVLGYLSSNLSASEIAAELYVSTSTVKTHMQHIYAKLNAHRRSQAVVHARELGLLGPTVRP